MIIQNIGNAANNRQNNRIYINNTKLREIRLQISQLVVIEANSSFIVGSAWPSNTEDELIGVHTPLFNQLGVNKPTNVEILTDLSKLNLIPISSISIDTDLQLDDRQSRLLQALIKDFLVELRFLKPEFKFSLHFKSKLNHFKVLDLDTGLSTLALNDNRRAYEVTPSTTIRLNSSTQNESLTSQATLIEPSTERPLIGGLSKQINEISDLIGLPLNYPDLFTRFAVKPPKGLLLHGPPGTGKTLLARSAATILSLPILLVNGPELSSAYHGETEDNLRKVFTHARSLTQNKGVIVVIDEIDTLCPSRDGDGSTGEVEKRVVATLLTELDGMNNGKDTNSPSVFLIGTTNRPNALDSALRRPGRLDREIEVGIPDASQRYEILTKQINSMPRNVTAEDIHSVATKTHGFVGADLSSLVRAASTRAIKRSIEEKTDAYLQVQDLVDALPHIRPSALRSVQLTLPETRFSDIAGQEHVKKSLEQSVIWPQRHADTFVRLGLTPPRGVLLYGPPGCSKTLAAKALAGESGINFLAVKGPELLDKFVGGSERAIRDIFAKARAAAPSIIFFDEIDSIASARDDNSSTTSGMVASMLNEMDGIEELNGVTVLAATNKPQVIDPALMRPGRLDRIIYVGPPEQEARKQLFALRLAKMTVEEGIDLDELSKMTQGCSGAEIVSICQDAAMRAMQESLNAEHVKKQHFIDACWAVRRRITTEMLTSFESWRDQQAAVM
ncbi:AAA-domain-containing protein [Wallemia mellicola]|uniref:AAA-domain-containing protein n=1 Tax=Wallemia mellicola TaxID=1708541 RepID=A0A4T0TCQ8_9BASI|nr:AAA-domain-containing protein [Wallemia mellicola]TIC62530.1 AAA-domain-containing protein [Wallemia mellicola]